MAFSTQLVIYVSPEKKLLQSTYTNISRSSKNKKIKTALQKIRMVLLSILLEMPKDCRYRRMA